jgi:hypothetical protein
MAGASLAGAPRPRNLGLSAGEQRHIDSEAFDHDGAALLLERVRR